MEAFEAAVGPTEELAIFGLSVVPFPLGSRGTGLCVDDAEHSRESGGQLEGTGAVPFSDAFPVLMLVGITTCCCPGSSIDGSTATGGFVPPDEAGLEKLDEAGPVVVGIAPKSKGALELAISLEPLLLSGIPTGLEPFLEDTKGETEGDSLTPEGVVTPMDELPVVEDSLLPSPNISTIAVVTVGLKIDSDALTAAGPMVDWEIEPSVKDTWVSISPFEVFEAIIGPPEGLAPSG